MGNNLAKSTRVTLVVPELGMKQDFLPEEAETLLRNPQNGGWVLPEDSDFEFDGNGIKRRAARKGAKGK